MKAIVSFETSGKNYQVLWLCIPEDESSTTPSGKSQDRPNNVWIKKPIRFQFLYSLFLFE